MRLRDKFWLWGHPEGVYNHKYGNEKESRMTPMEGCLYLGVRNTFMVPVGVKLDRRQYNKSFTTLREVGWECYAAATNPEVIEPLIREAGDFKNIGRVVFDDFQRNDKYKEIDVDNLWAINKRLHNNEIRPLDMWMVLYTHEFGLDAEKDEDFKRYIAPFDGRLRLNIACLGQRPLGHNRADQLINQHGKQDNVTDHGTFLAKL